MIRRLSIFWFFFFNDTATTEIYTLSLHDALPIWKRFAEGYALLEFRGFHRKISVRKVNHGILQRSEEHTSELQSRLHLVCRLLLEKKKTTLLNSDNATGQRFTRRAQWREPLYPPV